MAAVSAEENRRPPASLHEEDHLLTAINGLAEQLAETAREKGAALLTRFGRLAAEIDQLDLGQLTTRHPAGQPQMPGETALDQRRGLHRGGCGGKNHRHPEVLRRHQGKVAGVVARRILLFVRGVVLLVDHDQTEVLERREKRRAGADHDLRPAFANPLPLPPAITFGEGGMEDRGLRTEALLDRARSGGCETDLRHQYETTPAARQDLFEAAQIDLGLARPGDTLEEKWCVLPFCEGPTDRVDHLLLFVGQDVAVANRFEDPALTTLCLLFEPMHQARGIHRAQG